MAGGALKRGVATRMYAVEEGREGNKLLTECDCDDRMSATIRAAKLPVRPVLLELPAPPSSIC